VLLPLCGVNGVAVTPALALWLAYAALPWWRSPGRWGKRNGLVLWGLAATSLFLVGLHFLGYQRPHYAHHPWQIGLQDVLDLGLELADGGVERFEQGRFIIFPRFVLQSRFDLTKLCKRSRPLPGG